MLKYNMELLSLIYVMNKCYTDSNALGAFGSLLDQLRCKLLDLNCFLFRGTVYHITLTRILDL